MEKQTTFMRGDAEVRESSWLMIIGTVGSALEYLGWGWYWDKGLILNQSLSINTLRDGETQNHIGPIPEYVGYCGQGWYNKGPSIIINI